MQLFILYAMVYLFLFVVGSVLGSFFNVIVERVPQKLSFVSGRSRCSACGHTLAPTDLVPFFSFLCLGGRCRYCKTKLSFRYPLLELLGGLSAVGSAVTYGFSPLAAACCFLLLGLLAVAFIDLDTMTIPDGLVFYLIFPALGFAWFTPQTSLLSHIIGFFAVSVPLYLLAVFIRDCFGGGDIKLMAVCGFALGWKLALFALFVALLTGGSWGAYLLLCKKAARGAQMPFGPHLAIGVAAAALFGTPVVNWYFLLLF